MEKINNIYQENKPGEKYEANNNFLSPYCLHLKEETLDPGVIVIPLGNEAEAEEMYKLDGSSKSTKFNLLISHSSDNNLNDKAQNVKHNCHLCNQKFDDDADFRLHLDQHGQRANYNCESCKKLFFMTSTKLWQHICMKHIKKNKKEKQIFCCSLCNKSFNESHNFHQHMLIHLGERPEKCKHCEKAFRTKPSLAKHLLSHSMTKHFVCDLCHKAFKTRDELKQHFISHTTGKPFRCDHCQQAFKYEASMKRHVKKGRCQLGLHWVPLRKKVYKEKVNFDIKKSAKEVISKTINNITVKEISKLDAKDVKSHQPKGLSQPQMFNNQVTSDFIDIEYLHTLNNIDQDKSHNHEKLPKTSKVFQEINLPNSSNYPVDHNYYIEREQASGDSSFTDEDSNCGLFQDDNLLDMESFNIDLQDFSINSTFPDLLEYQQVSTSLLDMVNVV